MEGLPGLRRLPDPDRHRGRRGSVRLAAALQDPLDMVFDDHANRMLVLLPRSSQLIQLPADASGNIRPQNLARLNVRRFGVRQPQGMAVDPASGTLYISWTPPARNSSRSSRMPTAAWCRVPSPWWTCVPAVSAPRGGIAFDPSTGRCKSSAPGRQTLNEVTLDGQVSGSAISPRSTSKTRRPWSLPPVPH